MWLRLSPSLTLHLIERDPESNLVLRESASSVVRDPSKCPRQNHLGFGVSNYNQFVTSLKVKFKQKKSFIFYHKFIAV